MSKSKEKKVGSFTPKKENKKSIWDYKEYFLIGGVILLAAIIFILTLKNLGRNPAVKQSPTPSVTQVKESKDTGTLVVETEPPGAVAQVLDKALRTPATFKGMKAGKYFVVVRYPHYKIHNQQVEVKAKEETKIKITLEK